jgi:hypothetical protein
MLLLALALAAAQPSALEAAEKAAGKGPKDAPSQQMQSLVQNCDAHKFETVIELNAGGTVKHSRVKLCGTEGQSDADWIRTLKDAVAKTNANAQMPASARSQIVAAIGAEIARLEGKAAPVNTASLPPPRSAPKTAALDEYGSLPPLPNNPPPPVHVLPGGSAALPFLARPRMSFICFTPGELGEGPCTDFARDTLLTVRADEDLPSGTSLRFVRSGESRADVELAQLRRGKSMRIPLPPEVCSHAGGGRLEIRIVRSVPTAGAPRQEVGDDGPYNLRC